MINELGKNARVFDFDDTIIGRETVTCLSGLVMGKLRSCHAHKVTSGDIERLNIDHSPINIPVTGLKEKISLKIHALRKVYPGIREEFERLAATGTDIYGNTGRSHKKEWVNMTEETLRKGKVADYFRGIFYTPDGIRTAISKAHAIDRLTKQYDQVEFDEDDPRTALFIAKLFPHVNVNLIQYGSAGLLVSKTELSQYPNLKRAAHIS